MPTETVGLDWVGEQTFLLQDRAGFPVVMTQPMGVNGADLLPLSLIGCAAWDIIAILHKERQQVTGLHATAESTREEQPPWRFTRISVRYQLQGVNLSADKVRRAIELTEHKYCSTFATLRACVEIVSEFEITSEAEHVQAEKGAGERGGPGAQGS